MGKVPKPAMTKITGIPATNHGGARPASQVTRATFHHIVGDAAAAIAETRKASRQMSFSFCVGSDGAIYEGTGIGLMPYSDANYASNRITVSTEHAGGHPSVPYTEKMYQSSIRLHAWLIDELGINDFKRHRDVAQTACPGGLDVERIVREAKALRNSYYKETKKMVDEHQLSVLYRLRLGRPITDYGRANYLGKKTFAEVDALLMSSDAQKEATAQAKAGTLNVPDFLSQPLREVYKPATSSPKATILKKGIYEVQ